MSAAIDLDLGTCILGGFRKWPKEVNKLLKVSNKCVPTIGLAIGYRANQGTKIPKINKCYDNQYDINLILQETNKYNELIKRFYKNAINKEIDWKQTILKNMSKLSPNNSEKDIKEIFEF
jgi:hypothetical protein